MTITICILIFACVLFAGCVPGSYTEQYADPELWYDSGRGIDPDRADVFYLLPSSVYDWTDSAGVVRHNACMTDSVHRVRMARSFPIADEIFGDSANFFSPYYSQITLNAWTMDVQERDRYFDVAMADVRAAFSYYLEHWNQGRPFVLAGFSQGACCALQLLREMPADVADRMVAAYICGYHISAQELEECAAIRPAQGPDDTGVCIVYNTVSDLNAISPLVSGQNAVIINPASWTTDDRAYPVNDTVTVRIDHEHNVLVANGIEPSQYFKPRLAAIMPVGNLHLLELELYKSQLQDNVKLRIRKFSGAYGSRTRDL